MNATRMLDLLRKWTSGPIGWEDVITGYDFELLEAAEILCWAREQKLEGTVGQMFVEHGGEDREAFQMHMRDACAEATGRVPRPGSRLWARGQDRWRIALLKNVLDASPSPECLAALVESVYDMVGGPEDMLGLWRLPALWDTRPAHADLSAVAAFVQGLEGLRYGKHAA